MGITLAEFLALERRLADTRRKPADAQPSGGAEREVGRGGLHAQILDWCRQQHPRWIPVHARTDCPSTTDTGVADFIIFGPFPKCLVVECKSRTGKLSEAQRDWAFEMERLGWTVQVVRSLTEFETLCDDEDVQKAGLIQARA